MSKKMFLIVLFLLLIFTSSCKGEATPQATEEPGRMETQVAKEVSAQLTQIVLSQPAATQTSVPVVPATDLPSPTNTSLPPAEFSHTPEPANPTITPNPTNTAAAVTPTQRPSSTPTPAPFACQVVKQDPENGEIFKPDADFDAVWTVKNTGTALWDSNEADYRYESGDEFHQIEGYDLPKNVKPGESIDLTVDMKAPDEEGKYKTTWILHRGNHLLCTLILEINVEK